MRRALISAAAALFAAASMAWAQYPVGPIYPSNPQTVQNEMNAAPSSYDPFQLNWSTGRFVYTPLRYDAADANSPYKFNWYSGRWDYVPFAAPTAIVRGASPAPAPQPGIVNIPLRRPMAAPAPLPEAQPAAEKIQAEPLPPPKLLEKQSERSSATQPAATQPTKLLDPLRVDPNSGRWQYDPTTGRWQHILPPG